MRENLPVFPHRRAGFAGAPASFPADVIVEIFSPGDVSIDAARGLDGLAKPGLLAMRV
jgi:hypothetical protein